MATELRAASAPLSSKKLEWAAAARRAPTACVHIHLLRAHGGDALTRSAKLLEQSLVAGEELRVALAAVFVER